MDKIKAKNILIELSKSGNWECNCSECPLDEEFNKNINQKEINTYLKEHNLYDISTCSSRFLYICLKYKSKQIQNVIDYAKKITDDKTVFLEYGEGCPCGYLSELSKYVLNEMKQLDIE